MITLAELVAQSFSTTIALRGKVITLVPPTDQVQTMIRSAFSVPAAPLKKDPTKGSNAPLIENLDDPTYQAAMRDWNRGVERAEAAAAMQWQTASGKTIASTLVASANAAPALDPAAFKAWVIEAAAEVGAVLNRDEISAVLAAVKVKMAPGALEETLVKN